MNARGTQGKGAASEKTTCSRCQAPVYFYRDESVTRDCKTGRPHSESCPDSKPVTGWPEGAKPAKPVSPTGPQSRQLITMIGEDLMMIHPAGGGHLEVRRDPERWVMIGKAKRELGGIHITLEEFRLIVAALSAWTTGVHPTKLAGSIGEGKP